MIDRLMHAGMDVVRLNFSHGTQAEHAATVRLVRAGYVPQDILGTETTGYRFNVNITSDAKSFTAHAEPERYGRTGKLSFYLDKSGIQKKDVGGKPLSPSK